MFTLSGEPYEIPDRPSQAFFWRVFEWHFNVLEKKLGSDMGTQIWEE